MLGGLSLDDCPIVHYMRTKGDLDAENHPVEQMRWCPLLPARPTLGIPEHVIRCSGRWHAVLREMRARLSNFRVFRWGHGDWEKGRALDEARLLGAKVTRTAYLAFDLCRATSQWAKMRGGE